MPARSPYFVRRPPRFASTATAVQTSPENRACVRFLRCEEGVRPLARIPRSYGTILEPADASSLSNHIRRGLGGLEAPGMTVPLGVRRQPLTPPNGVGALLVQCTPHQSSIRGVPSIHQERVPAARPTQKVDHSCLQ